MSFNKDAIEDDIIEYAFENRTQSNKSNDMDLDMISTKYTCD